MNRLLSAGVLVALFALPGCVVVKERPRTSSSRSALSSHERECRPSQYWDGEKCRHKGKGHGARKHDD